MVMPVKWVRSGVLAQADALVAELGGDFPAIARAAGLDPRDLDDPDTPIPVLAVPRLIEQAARALACPSFALQLGQRQKIDLFGPLAPLFASAATLGALLRDLVDFFPLHTQGAIVGTEADPEGVLMTYELASFEAEAEPYPAHRHIVELGFSVFVGEVRRHVPGWVPAEVRFRHEAPADLAWYHRLFGTALLFNADRNTMLADSALLAAPTRGGDAALHGQLAAEHRAAARQQPGLAAAAAERVVRAALPFHPVTLAEAARLTRMSRRTLQRRLNASGTSLDRIVDAVRADLAHAYLRDSALSVAQIAEILQFSETSALSRAVRRWHGASPRAIRQRGAE